MWLIMYDGDDVADYNHKSNGVQKDLEEFENTHGNEIDGDYGEDDI